MKNPIQLGMSAFQVLLGILATNFSIRSLYFLVYQPGKLREESEKVCSLLMKQLHHDHRIELIEVRRSEVMEKFDTLKSTLQDGQVIGLTSRVKAGKSNEVLHLPLMDFNCEISGDNLEIIKDFMLAIGQKNGFILESGKSYHYYGAKPLTKDEWLEFLGRCLLFDKVDTRYVGHNLIEGYATIRITVGVRSPQIPTLVCMF